MVSNLKLKFSRLLKPAHPLVVGLKCRYTHGCPTIHSPLQSATRNSENMMGEAPPLNFPIPENTPATNPRYGECCCRSAPNLGGGSIVCRPGTQSSVLDFQFAWRGVGGESLRLNIQSLAIRSREVPAIGLAPPMKNLGLTIRKFIGVTPRAADSADNVVTKNASISLSLMNRKAQWPYPGGF